MDLFFVPHLRKVESRVYLSVILECSFDHVKHASIFPFTDLKRGITCMLVYRIHIDTVQPIMKHIQAIA